MVRSKLNSMTFTIAAPGAVSGALLNWFATHGRDLPWRRSQDPYRIWVSEVMLQQTRVDTVIPYYERWFTLFPTIQALAAAPEEQVLKAWEGLGYYSRARNLHRAAQEVLSRFDGVVPDDLPAMLSLPGVGSYTAGAVLSIAYGRDLPAVDGNVLRVLSRLLLITADVAQPATRRLLEQAATQLIPAGQARDFNQALMELGALICTPTSPRCAICPVAAFCRAREEGRQEELPVKAKAKAPRAVAMVAGVISHGGKVMIVRRPSAGLLGGLWEFPGGEQPDGLTAEQALHVLLSERHGLTLELEAQLCRVKHVFTHLVWDLAAFTAVPAPESRIPPQTDRLHWVTPEQLQAYALPVAHQKIAAALAACSNPQETVE
ncbi:MAG: A/G-specific adenine glycosylase [Mycobacterium leprae]